ncbi:unnamed protein product [Vicia faba]|uniref:SWIM-type domain-containing protein n=1 Tax=Vicia faba TaxID=3906 RepID=A0AAV0Z249_VICFA|nr:unnamed protein product [Vicia faba]
MGVFNLVFHHGGSFVQDGHTYYRGGSETTVECQDEDTWSFFEAVSLVKDWGYEGFRLWRKIPQTDEGFTNVVDDAGAVEVAKHCMSCRVHGDLWVEHGVEDMMTKVLVPNVDDFSTSSGDDSSGDYVDANQCFNDSEEERVIEVEEDKFERVEVDVPVSGNRVEIEGKSFRFKRCASKDPKKMKEKSKRDKISVLVPKSVLGSCSKRATRICEDVDYASEELESSDADESDMDDKPSKPKYEKFRSELLNKDFQFKLGMEFISLSEFKDAIRDWSVLNGREITFVKNESYRVRVECKSKCGFLALCSKVGGSLIYQLKTWVGTHTCARVLNNKSANSKWVSKLVVEKRKSQGKVKLSEIMSELRQKYSVGITKGKAWRAKAMAEEIIEGDAKEQYNMLWRYAAELRKHCAGNTVKLNTERPHPTLPLRFGRFYFCFDGCKKGFTKGCRPFIGTNKRDLLVSLRKCISKLNTGIANSVVKLDKWKHNVMPNPRKRLDKETYLSGEWLPTWSSGDLWQVHHPYNGLQFVVDIGKKTCTCCFWDLVGIPCRHVVSALQYQNLDPEKYVDPCYMREAYRACYENNVSPINGMDMWPTVDAEELLPPQYKKGPGRPKKLRFRELDENGSRMRRVGVAYRCTHCDKFGHNSRKCQAKEQDPNALKRKRKTPRTKVSKKSDANVDTTTTGGGTVDEDPEMDALLNNMMDLYEEQQSQVDNPTQPTAMQPPPTHESQPTAMQPPPTHDSQPAAMQPDPAATNVKKPSARKKPVAVPWKRSRKRVSERLKGVRNAKRHGGPGSTPDAPLTIGEETGGSTSKKISRKKRKGIDQ